MGKSKKKKVKLKRFVGSTAMDIIQEPSVSAPAPVGLQREEMDTSEIIVTHVKPASTKLSLGPGGGRTLTMKRNSNEIKMYKFVLERFQWFTRGLTSLRTLSRGLSSSAHSRVSKKGPQKRKAVKLRKEKALMKAMSMIDKQERRLTKQELRKYGKQALKEME